MTVNTMCARARIRCRESPEGNGSLLEDDGSRTEFEYDRQGNLLSERSGSGTTTYAYDTFNLTAKVEKPDGSYVRHEYDTEGLRSRICENGVTSRFVFDGWNMVNELDEEWNAKASYVRGHELLAQVDGQGDAYYYLNCYHEPAGRHRQQLRVRRLRPYLICFEGIPNHFRYPGEQSTSSCSNSTCARASITRSFPVHPGERVPRRRSGPVRIGVWGKDQVFADRLQLLLTIKRRLE
ncbi:RHS repeat domain-containing protein [Paenibacillus thiaminolyticus]|uniref:hypothetical protein n=1 Tax=Paenibacillus thiaminolyticus TaxID=49283 RepID=UPI003D2DDAB0